MNHGDRIWIPATYSHEVVHTNRDTFNVKTAIPDSSALPAVARLLADPATVAGLVELLTGVDWHYETPEAERAGRALLAALEDAE